MDKTLENASAPEAIKKTTTIKSRQPLPIKTRGKALSYSVIFWFISVLLGQWFFFYYIIKFYGFSVINNNMEIWNRWEVMGATPYHAGDFAGNMAFAAHAIGAGIVAFGGVFQLLPKMRSRFPAFHRVNGYVYLLTVILLALSGYYLVWFRDTNPIQLGDIGTSINGSLILGFAYLTVHSAIKKDIESHRKWAICLFLVSNAQWFLRVGVFSYLITGTTLGLNPAFGDPFFTLWTFGCFLIPLLTAQLFFYAQSSRNPRVKLAVSITLCVLTLLMLIGIMGYTPFLLSVMSEGPISM
ncbi:DUF2306 domain-containing protein [Pseudoalteromonas rubra]|uniref:DUF2306 domain-containing protein n=1 Tax=Pseudoalteromonas rubra TaxID=43658 RepID=A0A5S3X0X5_9GAMM|nr:DUF2306 domain-containing protein [Pseudoalteromonas rubra]TMP37576.1 hypothetical protein CWB98_10390 [Pseudoalteromonas rubra]